MSYHHQLNTPNASMHNEFSDPLSITSIPLPILDTFASFKPYDLSTVEIISEERRLAETRRMARLKKCCALSLFALIFIIAWESNTDNRALKYAIARYFAPQDLIRYCDELDLSGFLENPLRPFSPQELSIESADAHTRYSIDSCVLMSSVGQLWIPVVMLVFTMTLFITAIAP